MVLDKLSLCHQSNNWYAFTVTPNNGYYVSAGSVPSVLSTFLSLAVYVSLNYVPSTSHRAYWIIDTHDLLDLCMIQSIIILSSKALLKK